MLNVRCGLGVGDCIVDFENVERCGEVAHNCFHFRFGLVVGGYGVNLEECVAEVIYDHRTRVYHAWK